MPAQTFYTGVNVSDQRDTRHFMHYTNENNGKDDNKHMTVWQQKSNTNTVFNNLKKRPLSAWKSASLRLQQQRESAYKTRATTSLSPIPPSRQTVTEAASSSALAVPLSAESCESSSTDKENSPCAPEYSHQGKSLEELPARKLQMHSRLMKLLSSPYCQLQCVADHWNVFYTRHVRSMLQLLSEEKLEEENREEPSSLEVESDSLKVSTSKTLYTYDDNGACILYICPFQECHNNVSSEEVVENSKLSSADCATYANTGNSITIRHSKQEHSTTTTTTHNCTLSVLYHLYCALAEAGVCVLPTYSLLDVCELRWKELLSCPSIRLQLRLMHNAKARSLLHMSEAEQNTLVQVAVLYYSVFSPSSFAPSFSSMESSASPLCRELSTLTLSSEQMSQRGNDTQHIDYRTYHNVDAQLFQRLYVILMLYIIYDIRFVNYSTKESSSSGQEEICSVLHKEHSRLSTAHSRSQRSKRSACHPFHCEEEETFVAFEHPTEVSRWLCFPHSTPFSLSIDELARLSTYTCVEWQERKAHYNEKEENSNRVKRSQRSHYPVSLLEMTQCVMHDVQVFARNSTRVKSVMEWAARQYIESVEDAKLACIALFELFSHKYICSRAELWHLSRTRKVKIYRCNEQLVRTRLHRHLLYQKTFTVKDDHLHNENVVECSIRQVSTRLERERKETSMCVFATENKEHDKEYEDDRSAADRSGDDAKSNIKNACNDSDVQWSETQTHREMTSFSVLPDHMSLTRDTPLQNRQHEHWSSATEVKLHKKDDSKDDDTKNHDSSINNDMYEHHKGADHAAEEPYIVSPTSPYTHHESLVSRWRQYIRDGDYTVFAHSHERIELEKCIGVGGSGIVYRGTYGARRLLVAVKIFVRIDGVTEEEYIRQSLTDVAFYVLFNQLDDYGICHTCRAHDFIISDTLPTGMTVEDATTARLGRNDTHVQLCYLVTDLMEGTLGRFLTASDDDYDACYDTLHNSPLSAGELFQFLYTQLVIRCIFDWVILDVMLHGQLRGDNMGYQFIHPHSMLASRSANNKMNNASEESNNHNFTESTIEYWNCVYDGIIVQYSFAEGDEVRYLYFPAEECTVNQEDTKSSDNNVQLMRFIYFVDLGQGLQPSVNDLTKRNLIGETLVDSCLNEDGLGRYWPLNKLYCKYIETRSCCERDKAILEQVYEYASEVEINNEQDVVHALQKLFDLYAVKYGMVHAPTREQLRTNLVLTWSPQIVNALREAYVYRDN